MLEAYIGGKSIAVTQVATQIGVDPSCISAELSILRDGGFAWKKNRVWKLTEAGIAEAVTLFPLERQIKVKRLLNPRPHMLQHLGTTAAGTPRRLVVDNSDDAFGVCEDGEYHSDTHFTMIIEGTSMKHRGIQSGVLGIFELVENWSQARSDDIMVVWVPEDTDVMHDDWLERLPSLLHVDGRQEEACDCTTLKEVTLREVSFFRAGRQEHRLVGRLDGRFGTLYPAAAQPLGLLIEYRHKIQRKKSL
ncbi:MAG: hypothetical protein ACJ8CR_25040 [Roseiflexaceae bacterium]